MAKNRFSNQRPENYSRSYRYGLSAYNERKSVKKSIDENKIAYIRYLLSYSLTEWETNFIKTILQNRTELSVKQNEIIQKLFRKFNITKKQKRNRK